MKQVLLCLCLFFVIKSLAQNNPISSITISLPPNPDASIANWKGGTSILTISAVARAVNGRPDVRVEDSKILVVIKKSGGKVCGSFTNSSAPAANFTTLNKVWSGNNAVALLGQECTLPHGEYELVVQFFGNGPRGLEPISEEKSRAFTIRGNEQQTYQPPQPMLPANGTILKEDEIKKPVTFRWTPVVPRPQDPVTYRLRVWRMTEGQNSIPATIIQQPILGNEVSNITQSTIVQLRQSPPDRNVQETYVWNVQALNRDGKPIGGNNGTSEAFIITVQPVNDAPVAIKLVTPVNRSTFSANDKIRFNWSINNSNSSITHYKLKIAEILLNQSPYDALRTNKPHFEKDSLKELSFVDAPIFVSGKKYAWAVEANGERGVKITESEINEFIVSTNTTSTARLSLISPANRETVRVQNPTFSWDSYLTPADYDGDGYYKIKIVEIKGDESPDNAFRTNKPFFEKDSIARFKGNKPFFERDSLIRLDIQYASSALKLEPGKRYAWNVQALNRDGRPVGSNNGTSDVWKFTVAPLTAVKIDSIKLNCTSTYGIYNYTVYVTNPLTMNVVLNGFWCRKPVDVNLTQLYTLNSQTPSLGTQITAGAQIIVSGQVNLTSHTPNTMVRFSLRTHKINDPVDNATVTDSIKVANCACDPCEKKQTIFGNGAAPVINSSNNGLMNISSTVSHTPFKVIKVAAQIVNVERLGETGCLRCTNESKDFGTFTGGSLNNTGGHIVNGTNGYGKQIQWQTAAPVMVNNFNYALQMKFPPLTEVSCCKDSIKVCVRWTFTDENCISCDTLICNVVVREYKKPSGPISTSGAGYASHIKAMGKPFSDWYDQETDELPKYFSKQLEELWQKELRTTEAKVLREEFEENLTGIFFTIRGLKAKGGEADPIVEIIKNTMKANSPNTQCGNGDFETGQLNMNEWGGGYGTIQTNNNPSLGGGNYSSGFSPSPVGVNLSNSLSSNNHSIVSQGSLPSVITSLPSNLYAFRLGNAATGKGSEILSKRFTVDANGSGIIKFMYALILQDPGTSHDPPQKPSFWVKVYDDSWNLITGKVYLDPLSSSPLESMVANVSNPFFQVTGSVVYRDWTCAKIDLSDYKGKEVTVAFITTDCTQGLHYGHAYIDNWCGNCDGATTGSVSINTIADACIKQGTKVCVNYTLPKIGTNTGSGTLKLQFYRNGSVFGTPLTQAVNSSTPNPYCFSIDPAKLPCNNGQDGYDMVVTGDFNITASGTTSSITVTSPDPVGNPVEGIKPGQNNDLVCCIPQIPPTLYDLCCNNFTKNVTSQVSMVGNNNVGYNTVKIVPTFKVGPKLIKKVRISVVNFEVTSKNKECLTCESNTTRYGSMAAPQNIMGGGKDPIEGMNYLTNVISANCVGCPPKWSNRLSSEVTWGSDAGAGYNLMDGVGDQSTTFNIYLPKKSTISCCDDTVRICIKYSFTDVDCRTCDTIICYKIVNRTTISQPVSVSFIKAGEKNTERDEHFNKSVIKKNDEKHATVAFINIEPNYEQREDSNQNRRPKDQKIDMLTKEIYFAYRR